MENGLNAKTKLLLTDTDSLCYEKKTDNIYQDILQDINLFDTSEYAHRHTGFVFIGGGGGGGVRVCLPDSIVLLNCISRSYLPVCYL